MPVPQATIALTVPEAVVFDAFLQRYSETSRLEIVDQAEQRALWNLQSLVEKIGDPAWPAIDDARAERRDEAVSRDRWRSGTVEAEAFDRSLRAFARRSPFKPYVVEWNSGSRLQVDHPEALVFRSGVAVHFALDGTPTLFDHQDASQVTALNDVTAA